MSNNPKTIRVAYFTKGVETHHYMEPWEKSPFFCPACGYAEVWRCANGGDYYVGELYLCIRQECGSRFYLPNGAEPYPTDEQDQQRLTALRGSACLDSVVGASMPKSGMKMLHEQSPTIAQHLAQVDNLFRVIMQQREQMLAAFIAETGCKPSECEQVMQYTPTGFKCWIQKREE